MRTCVCAQQSLHRAFGANQWHSRIRFIRLLFLQLVLDFNKLVGELGQVRPRLVRATADVGVCALRCSGEMQLVRCQAQRNTQAHNSSSPRAPPQSIPLKR